jgi:hypothetical protein
VNRPGSELVAILRRSRPAVAIAIVALVGSGALWLASSLRPPPAALVELFHWPLRLLGLLLAAALLAVWAVAVFIAGPARQRLCGAVVAVALTSGFAWLRIHTDVGVFALDGGSHWIAKADAATSIDDRRRYLALVLSATQYGANIAEAGVARYPPERQAVLFETLASATESELWTRRFRKLAHQARYSNPHLASHRRP